MTHQRKHVFIVTHGEKEGGTNPNMTVKGFKQISSLKKFLPSPEKTGDIVAGTGARHFAVAVVLNLNKKIRYTAVVGGPDSMEIINNEKMIRLSNGILVDFDQYTTLQDMEESTKNTIKSLVNNSIICAGRPCLIMLGFNNPKSAAIYKVTIIKNKIENIEEIAAYGKSEKGTV